MVATDDNSGRQRRQQMTMARKIGQLTTRGKEDSGWQTTTTLGLPGREREKKEIKFMQKDLIQQYGLSSWIFCSRQNTRYGVLV
jgi:hypothetical protein